VQAQRVAMGEHGSADGAALLAGNSQAH